MSIGIFTHSLLFLEYKLLIIAFLWYYRIMIDIFFKLCSFLLLYNCAISHVHRCAAIRYMIFWQVPIDADYATIFLGILNTIRYCSTCPCIIFLAIMEPTMGTTYRISLISKQWIIMSPTSLETTPMKRVIVFSIRTE